MLSGGRARDAPFGAQLSLARMVLLIGYGQQAEKGSTDEREYS